MFSFSWEYNILENYNTSEFKNKNEHYLHLAKHIVVFLFKGGLCSSHLHYLFKTANCLLQESSNN